MANWIKLPDQWVNMDLIERVFITNVTVGNPAYRVDGQGAGAQMLLAGPFVTFEQAKTVAEHLMGIAAPEAPVVKTEFQLDDVST